MTATESVRIPKSILDRVRKLAQEQRRSLVGQIAVLLEKALRGSK
jgi:hypothetical protein